MRRFLIGLAVTAVCTGLLLRLIPWGATREALRSANPALIALAVTCLVASLIAKTVRWRLLLPDDSPVTTPGLYRILHISFLLNNVLPARLGDVARVTMTSRQPGIRFGHVVSSMLTERVTDTVTLLLGFLVVSPFLPVPERYQPWLAVAWAVIAGLVALVLFAAIFRGQIGGLARSERIARHIPANRVLRAEGTSFLEGLRVLFSRRHAISIWGWSWTAWVAAFAINYVLMRALSIQAPVAVAVLLTCTTNLAMLIPSSPGYIGVFHLAATASLLPFNVGESRALSFAILAHLVNVVPVSIIGAVALMAGRDGYSFSLHGLRAPAQVVAEDGVVPGAEAPDQT